ncbi:MAG TPA: NADH-quinone oxidoreductase subunit NuoF [Armatimonadota bacterium]
MLGPRLYRYTDDADQWRLETYLKHDGYQGLKKALEMGREAATAWVADANIRGRGGAGFPMARKWGTIPKTATTIYLTCNADESEPGTCSNREILENDPHQLLESMLIEAFCVGVRDAYIYIRGEYRLGAERLLAAVEEARAAGYLGDGVLGTDFNCNIWVHRGAGAYICGEETALIESLEGKRGQPRIRPPYFPTVMGLKDKPTVVNNVETICNLAHLFRLGGPDKFKEIGTQTSTGSKLYCISGHVKNPGVYETTFQVTMRQLIWDYAGGMLDEAHPLKAVIPGGASFQWWTQDQLDVIMDFDSVRAAGSNLGSAGVMVMDDTTCAVDACLNLVEFFAHESCGKCTPCREGTHWLVEILHRIEHGEGRPGDPDLLLDICENIGGRAFCLLGDSAIVPVQSSIQLFRDEYEYHIREKKCLAHQRYRLSH